MKVPGEYFPLTTTHYCFLLSVPVKRRAVYLHQHSTEYHDFFVRPQIKHPEVLFFNMLKFVANTEMHIVYPSLQYSDTSHLFPPSV